MRRTNRRYTSAPLAAVVAMLAASALTLPAAPASAQAGDGHTAVINGAVRHQVITGFGASGAFGQAETVMNAPAGSPAPGRSGSGPAPATAAST